MKAETIRELKALLTNAKIREREAQDKYDAARHIRSALETTISIVQEEASSKR